MQGHLYYVVIIYFLRINKINESSPKTLKPTLHPLLELPRLFFVEGVVLGARFPSSVVDVPTEKNTSITMTSSSPI